MSGWIRGAWKAGKEAFKKQKTTGKEVIKSFKASVGDKSLSKLKISTQKTKGGAAKLKQTLWESKTGEYKKSGFTFAHDRGNVAKKSKKKSKKKSWKDQVDTSHPSYKD